MFYVSTKIPGQFIYYLFYEQWCLEENADTANSLLQYLTTITYKKKRLSIDHSRKLGTR